MSTSEKKSTRTRGAQIGRVRATVDPGVCGFHAEIVAEAESMRKVKLEITSDCAAIQKAADRLPEVNMLEETRAGLGQGQVYGALSECVRHVTCPVGSGILKACEAAAGLALPRDASIKLERE